MCRMHDTAAAPSPPRGAERVGVRWGDDRSRDPDGGRTGTRMRTIHGSGHGGLSCKASRTHDLPHLTLTLSAPEGGEGIGV